MYTSHLDIVVLLAHPMVMNKMSLSCLVNNCFEKENETLRRRSSTACICKTSQRSTIRFKIITKIAVKYKIKRSEDCLDEQESLSNCSQGSTRLLTALGKD